jgi:hypothetical protein
VRISPRTSSARTRSKYLNSRYCQQSPARWAERRFAATALSHQRPDAGCQLVLLRRPSALAVPSPPRRTGGSNDITLVPKKPQRLRTVLSADEVFEFVDCMAALDAASAWKPE